jgi:hypothetical protein
MGRPRVDLEKIQMIWARTVALQGVTGRAFINRYSQGIGEGGVGLENEQILFAHKIGNIYSASTPSTSPNSIDVQSNCVPDVMVSFVNERKHIF